MAHEHAHHADASHEAPSAHGYGHEGEHGVGHIVSPKILIATAAALLCLTVVTVLAGKLDFSQLDLNELNIFVALAIAVVKATLVCLFFMHLRWDRPFNAFVLVASLAAVALFIGFAMTDTAEYSNEIIQGESALIQNRLVEVQAATGDSPTPSPVPHGGGSH
jgi:cytochrome c oxidase subunit 4